MRLCLLRPCLLLSGQEDATVNYDEGVSITPFNLDEEMEEGHFDAEGNYFIKKDKEIKDNWLDNIDWVMNGFSSTYFFKSSMYMKKKTFSFR